MRNILQNHVLLISIFLLLVMHTYAQTYSIHGRVTDQQGNPIENSLIFIIKSDKQTLTDVNGVFQINIDEGQYLYIQKENYAVKKLEYISNKAPNGQWDIVLTSLKDTDIFYETPEDDYASFSFWMYKYWPSSIFI